MQTQRIEPGSEAYLEAFMSGYEFVLLALRGRLNAPELGPAERSHLEALLSDYAHIAEAYHARRPQKVAPLRLGAVIPADLPPAMIN